MDNKLTEFEELDYLGKLKFSEKELSGLIQEWANTEIAMIKNFWPENRDPDKRKELLDKLSAGHSQTNLGKATEFALGIIKDLISKEEEAN